MSQINLHHFKRIQIPLMIILLVIMSITVEELTNHHISGAEILFIRSVCNLLTVTFFFFIFKDRFTFTQIPSQIGVFIFSGLSLLLLFTAYEYISAASVSVLQRLDMPMLILILAFYKPSQSNQVIWSLLAFVFVLALIFFNQTTDEDPFGYFLVLAGILSISINTLLQRRIAFTENILIIIFASSLSAVCWSGLQCWRAGVTFSNISLLSLLVIVILSLMNLVIFYIITDLYKTKNIEVVRYPYLIAGFLTMIVEMIIENKIFNSLLIAGNVLILISMTMLIRSQKVNENEKKIIIIE